MTTTSILKMGYSIKSLVRRLCCHVNSKRVGLVLLPSLLLLLYLTLTDRVPDTVERSMLSVPADRHENNPGFDSTDNLRLTNQNGGFRYHFEEKDLNKRMKFSTEGDGEGAVMVFLHMQKTGGTFFGKNLVKNLKLKSECKCSKGDGMLKCPCMSVDQKRYWLFSRYSTGWKCGLHADFTELHECLAAGKLDELEGFSRPRKYYYISMLREPLQRYVSEWLHVARGASWISSTLRCGGKSPSLKDVPFCYSGDSWANVTLEQFLSCPHNLARNRQTRMLANLTEIGCYTSDMMDNSDKKRAMLESAKLNLKQLPFFAIMQYLKESQTMFEWTFNLKFKGAMSEQRNRHDRNSGDVLASLSKELKDRVTEANDLDIELYQYATDLFLQRYEYAKRNWFS